MYSTFLRYGIHFPYCRTSYCPNTEDYGHNALYGNAACHIFLTAYHNVNTLPYAPTLPISPGVSRPAWPHRKSEREEARTRTEETSLQAPRRTTHSRRFHVRVGLKKRRDAAARGSGALAAAARRLGGRSAPARRLVRLPEARGARRRLDRGARADTAAPAAGLGHSAPRRRPRQGRAGRQEGAADAPLPHVPRALRRRTSVALVGASNRCHCS